MNKTKIEWCDSSWNPITGCLHGCEYCYARRIANRFKGYTTGGIMNLKHHREETKELHVLDKALWRMPKKYYGGKLPKAPYPYGFDPTLHRYKLDEPQKVKKPQNIFVCSMADLFGDWVPNEWMSEVFQACEKAPQHNYLFLTKNPEKTSKYDDYIQHKRNWWFGMSATIQSDLDKLSLMTLNANRFISIEPLLGEIDIEKRLCGCRVPFADWVIIGAETGNRKGKVIPKAEWIEQIVNECDKKNVPVFMKNSLIPIIGENNMRRDFPRGLRRD